jgi:hypothetical protein
VYTDEPRAPTEEDLRLFRTVAQDIRSSPDEYIAAGGWLDEYCSEAGYWQREEKRLDALKRWAAAGGHTPSPDVWHLEQKLKQKETPQLYNRFADAYHFLTKKCEGQVCVSEEDARRILLVTWLLTDPKAEFLEAHVTNLQTWAWESTTDMPGSRLNASKSWVRIYYVPWMRLARLAWQQVSNLDSVRSQDAAGGALAGRLKENLPKAIIRHLPYIGPFLYDLVWGVSTESHREQGQVMERAGQRKKSRLNRPHSTDKNEGGGERWFRNRTIQAALIGAIVLLSTSIIGWYLQYGRSYASEDPNVRAAASVPDKLLHSLRDVCDDIDARPLLQRDDTAKNYVGFVVKRELLSLREIGREGQTFLLLMVFPGEPYVPFSGGWGISCEVRKEAYSELTGAKRGLQLYVSGVVQEAAGNSIMLRDASIELE